MQRAGGIGTLLVLIRDVRPDPNFKPKKGSDQDSWGAVADIYEAGIKALAAASFVNTRWDVFCGCVCAYIYVYKCVCMCTYMHMYTFMKVALRRLLLPRL